MELQSLLILFGISAAASMDSFSAVLAYSAAGIHIPPRSVWTLGLVSGGLLGLSVLAGSRLGALGAVAQIAGAVLLILLGAGNLGKAIAGHMPFEQLGFSLIGVFDNAKRVIGGKISGNEILDYATVEEFYQEHHPVMAILCVPREYVEGVSDELYSLGIHSFWNFSHYDITMKHPDAIVENVHMNDSLMTLSYKLALAEAGDSGQAAG